MLLPSTVTRIRYFYILLFMKDFKFSNAEFCKIYSAVYSGTKTYDSFYQLEALDLKYLIVKSIFFHLIFIITDSSQLLISLGTVQADNCIQLLDI